jgi:hypothetical protein
MLDGLLGWSPRGSVIVGGAPPRGFVPVPRPQFIVTGALAIWTGFSGLCLLFTHDNLARLIAGGLADAAGQRLLGANLLILAALYLLIVSRPAVYAALGWLPLVAEGLTALVTGYEVVVGNRGFGWGWLALVVSLAFSLTLAGFRMAGGPVYRDERASIARHSALRDAQELNDAPTERLTVERPAAHPSTPKTSIDPPEDGVLGI